ncbi:hypothetical protein [Spirochaeta dissipatitropha]
MAEKKSATKYNTLKCFGNEPLRAKQYLRINKTAWYTASKPMAKET